MNFQFKQNSLNLRLFTTSMSESEVIEFGRNLKKGAAKFLPQERVPGFTDVDAERDVVTGVYACVTTSAVSSYNLETQNDEPILINVLETCEFVMCPKLLIVSGSGPAIKLIEPAVSAMTGCSVVGKEFDYAEMEALLDILTNIKAISVKNPKESEVRSANITGVIEDLDGYNFLAAQPEHRTIESIRGAYKLDGLAVEVKLTRKGGLTITARRGLEISLESIVEFLRVIEGRSDLDEPDESPDEESINNLF